MVVSATRNMHGRVGQVCVQRASVGSQPVQALGIYWFGRLLVWASVGLGLCLEL